MRTTQLRERLTKGVLFGDGGIGTQLPQAGLPAAGCGEQWNLERPDAIRAIHQSYLDAGSRLLTTNTFRGCRAALERYGVGDRTVEINRAGATLAREAAGEQAWVLGDVGPFGGYLEPLGETTPEQLADLFVEQASALHEGGADAIIVETMTDPQELAVAVRACRSVADWPVFATFAFDAAGQDFRTFMGAAVDDAMRAAIDAGADVVGANCGTNLDLDAYRRLAEHLVAAADGVHVILQPNAGSPVAEGDRVSYPATPQQMAALAPKLIDAGVRVIGGCCGTTPAHLRAMIEAAASPA